MLSWYSFLEVICQFLHILDECLDDVVLALQIFVVNVLMDGEVIFFLTHVDLVDRLHVVLVLLLHPLGESIKNEQRVVATRVRLRRDFLEGHLEQNVYDWL